MELGIIGLPQVGKRTLFSILTGVRAEEAPERSGIRYGTVMVRDPRVDALAALYKPKRTKYAEFSIALAPDITPNAARAADWLEPLRQVDGYIHLVREFENPSVYHIESSINPRRDLSLVDTELLFADLDLVEKRLERMAKERTKKDAGIKEKEKQVLEKCRAHLEAEQPLRSMSLGDEDRAVLHNLQLLTLKPVVVVVNTGRDSGEADAMFADWKAELETQPNTRTVILNAAIESELTELDEQERREFMADLGIAEPAVHVLSRAAFESLGLICFFTVGEDEVKAWPVRRNATAVEAAGRIHSDLERGFIRAEAIGYDELMEAGTEEAARKANLYRLKGKDYVVQDGDILNIRFNV